ncbi:glycogen operon protein GlgX homolog [Bradyrhizobium sp. SSBR45G]|uniref:glycogen debranching protein GlgX n=1 Tax=unclassified Bradyrhizobium TaxID=2631580 RepID=UPI0023429200|nr:MULTISPECIES: glycogen debranching protein GlgX [unclassified Bradyrhizobium]GLH78294.1 glycogen operon protein GlgX homolog [Bradyrhizobium sp. SSBR45G]GLH85938.1 glycogen operon protein GlgX homolog [Bradyrhizobium sp. SSBR45R]
MRLAAGSPARLGATWDGRGTNFALFSANAEKVELCLFDSQGRREIERIELPERTEDVWHVYLNDVSPGQLYGYRVYGPYEPERGHRFNANKLVLDPYAKRLAGRLVWSDAHFAYRAGSPREDLSFDRRDNARGMPKGVVIDETFNWGRREMRPQIPWEDTIIYEAHVKGLTNRRDDVPPNLRGTYGGLSSPAMIKHLKRLGVTTVELLPIHAFIDDRMLVEKKLVNYWGYNTISFFAPEQRYAQDNPLDAFRTTVARLHDAGIEVMLDVVYNHTAEGNHLGPTLCYRGIDNASYYWLQPDNPRFYDDFTGCGSSVNLTHPRVLQMVMDSLRYWVEVCHVDGFRFDLATTLAREKHGFDRRTGFLTAIRQDPVLASVKLVAEPWDVGLGGYQVGAFPSQWSEWNDRYRSAMRRYWSGEGSLIGEVSSRMTGSSDIFNHDGRTQRASVNHVTVHDGFTLADLFSYNSKHNEANGEDNRDGSNDNHSNNFGHEGPTDDVMINALRRQSRKNQLACLFLAQGLPLLLAGDEVGNSQAGNNNAYCQDNEVGWVDWSGMGREGCDLIDFIAHMTDLRRRFGQIRARRWLDGRRPDGSFGVLWLTPSAEEMTQTDWTFPDGRFLAYVLAPVEPEQAPIFIVLNAAPEDIGFKLPRLDEYKNWQQVLDTTQAQQKPIDFASGAELKAPPRSVLAYAGLS